MSESVVVITSAAEFEETMKNSLVLVDFWAPWCGPCRAQLPILTKVAEHFLQRAIVAKVNVDEQGDLAARYGVSSIPALFVFHNGKVVQQFLGVQDEKTLVAALDTALSNI